MPTRYWLVGEPERTPGRPASRATGGVDAGRGRGRRRASSPRPTPATRPSATRRCRPATPGPGPSGGVGGTRTGVKCLHAHYAWFLAGGDDPVGRWVDDRDRRPVVASVVRGMVDDRRRRSTSAPTRPASSWRGRRRRPARHARPAQHASPAWARAWTPPDGWPPRPSSGRSPCLRELPRRSSTATGSSGCGSRPRPPPATPPTATSSSTRSRRSSASGPSCCRGDEEGRLSFLGATADLDPALGPFLVVDIGGGSTEFIVGTDQVEGVISVDVGCVRLTEKFLDHDPPLPEELTACISFADAYLDDVVREIPGVAEARTLVGLAGTVTTVAAVEIGLATYDRDRIHHFVLTHDAAEDVFRTLATEAAGRPHPQPGARGGAGRRDRRRLLRAGGDLPPLRLRRDDRVRGRHPRRPGAQPRCPMHPPTRGRRASQVATCRR